MNFYLSFFFSFFLVFWTTFLAAQIRESNFYVNYKFVYLEDTTKPDKYVSPTSLVLYSDGEEVIFMSKARYTMDSLSVDYFGEGGSRKFSNEEKRAEAESDFFVKNKGKLYLSWYDFTCRHLIKRNLSFTTYLTMSNSYTSSNPPELDWEISSKIDTLIGVEVKEATVHYAGRNYIAWFAPSIPIPFGPYVFKGLPGLILKIYDMDKKFVFEATKIYSSGPRYFMKKLDTQVAMAATLQRKEWIAKVHGEIKGSNPDVLDIIGESKSERLQTQLNQAKRNSKKWYLLMELY
jgi:GLPGLI family protein